MAHLLAAVLVLLLVGFGLAVPARSAPLDPGLQQQLLALYDRYNQAIAAGKLDEALATRSSETRRRLQDEVANRKKRQEFLDFSQHMIPDTLEVRHTSLAADGTRATILMVASKKIPEDLKIPNGPPPGSTVRNELTLDFVKEGSAWTYDTQTFGMDPDKIKACADQNFEPIDAYDRERHLSMGGPIARVAFNADHTLVIVRVLDEENCVFLPARTKLAEHGFNPDLLVPYAIISAEGFPHKADNQKVWIDDFSVSGD